MPAGTATPCPTPLGGTHEAGLRNALLKGLRTHAERIGFRKRARQVTADDVIGGACVLLSLFIRQPQFQGQTKERLVSPEADPPGRERAQGPLRALARQPRGDGRGALLEHVAGRAEERLARRKAKEEVGRKTATRKLRLPGKLADCSRDARDGTEIFIVEGDSRRRLGQAGAQPRDPGDPARCAARSSTSPRRTADKLAGNKELADLVTALGCGAGKHWRPTTCATTRS